MRGGSQSLLLLGNQLLCLCLLLLGERGVRLETEDVSTPLAAELIGLVVVLGLDRGNELGELVLVLVLDTGDDEGGGGLLVDDGTEACLALDDGVGDVQLAAKGGKPNDELEKLFVNTTKGVPKK